tara:strand:+ start:511 stop:672 length:162 start_codon:yes stop_codon:yes gene_type:complete
MDKNTKRTIDLTPDKKSLIRTLAFIVEHGAKQSDRNWAMKQMERIDNEQKKSN